MYLEGWKASQNQRKFCDAFARSKKFNPLDSEKWYSVTRYELSKAVSFLWLSVMIIIPPIDHYLRGEVVYFDITMDHISER